ncbi:GNAT family N-acetyltransferase [Stakelama sp. CBK3Z-3]|uniref:GNAT family N-acetyltransferase n=1 Tax=Stakelama flava TaxID=2860338 RepID=A0ABS6XKY8_9SPHN|nr:GNAT family N-acetyltransferase [Stakelama flava]MBW4330816.1 GNAT family N-acetyltransferase [Stakelama flava]
MTTQNSLTTSGGVQLNVRPAREGDEALLDAFFSHVTPEDLRFRFLSSVRKVGADQIAAMTHVDHRQTENLLAFDARGDRLVATAMLACDDALERGEVAVVLDRDYKGRGIGWEMLRLITETAREQGVKEVESIESRENHAAIDLEREMGFTAQSCPGDSTLVLVRRSLRPD